jgi:DNA-binding MarR family transcriptional regulator
MSGLVDRAEKRGLVMREPSATDGRSVDVFLSPAGVELAERLSAEVGRSLAPLTDPLTPSERRRLQTLLEKTVDAG